MKNILFVSVLLALSSSVSAQSAQDVGSQWSPAQNPQSWQPTNISNIQNTPAFQQSQNQQAAQQAALQNQNQNSQQYDLDARWPDQATQDAPVEQNEQAVPAVGQIGAGQLGGPIQSPVVPGQAEAPLARPPADNSEFTKMMWQFDPSQQLRQSGERLERADARGFASSRSSSDQVRLQEWSRHLQNAGVPEQKIMFEAKRLSKDDFELWASRFVWWEQSVHPRRLDVE